MISRAIPLLAAAMLAASPGLAAPISPSPPLATVETLLTQARAATVKGDIELALRLAQSAVVADPARPTSYVALGDIYAQAGQAEYARNFYDAALGIDPMDPGALKALAALDQGRTSATANAAR